MRVGQLVERPGLLGADHTAAELGAGDRPLDRAGGQTIVLAAIVVAADRDLPSPASAPSPSITSILFFLNSPATPPVSVLITFSRRCDDGGEVDLRLADLDAELAGLADLGEDVGDAQHGLGRDAGVVQAAAADRVLLDHGGLHPELGGADRGHVAARARSR